MSYHILHQFDEQWFADGAQQNDQSRSNGFFDIRNYPGREGQNLRTNSTRRPWLIVGMSLIIAACALYFAMDTRRQTIELQQRLSDVESRIKK